MFYPNLFEMVFIQLGENRIYSQKIKLWKVIPILKQNDIYR